MPEHSTLTGADLHEPKGVETASAGTVYVSDGAGSGTWILLPATSLGASNFNVNKRIVYVRFPDVSTAGSVYVPIVDNCTITKITSVLQAAITGADSTVTVYNNAGVSMGTLTIAYSGSAAGDKDTLSPSANNTFTNGQNLRIASDGASSTAADLVIVLEYTVTS